MDAGFWVGIVPIALLFNLAWHIAVIVFLYKILQALKHLGSTT